MKFRGAAGEWIFAGGLAIVLVLIACVATISLLLSRRVETETADVDRRAERSAHLIGEVGELVTRIWAETLDTTTEQDGAVVEKLVASINRQRAEVDAALAILPSQLAPGDADRNFATVSRDIMALRDTLDRALALRLAGRAGDAEALLDTVTDDHERIAGELQALDDAAHHASVDALARSEHAMASARLAEALSFAALFVATLAIGAFLVVNVRRRRRAIALHLTALEIANADLEAFAGRIAHDLKNMLAPVSLALPTLTRASSTPEARAQAAARVERSVRRAVDVLEGLLVFARAGAPLAGTGNKRVAGGVGVVGGAAAAACASVCDELDAVLEELAPAIEASGAVVERDVAAGLEISCAPALLHVVLLNLVGNAVKFLAGRPERRVRIEARAESSSASSPSSCRILVADTGPGIPAAAVSRIFEPFFRAPGVTASGSGIGLATVRRIVDGHGGRVDVESREGGGSIFTVTMPLAAVDSSAHGCRDAPPPEVGAVHALEEARPRRNGRGVPRAP